MGSLISLMMKSCESYNPNFDEIDSKRLEDMDKSMHNLSVKNNEEIEATLTRQYGRSVRDILCRYDLMFEEVRMLYPTDRQENWSVIAYQYAVVSPDDQVSRIGERANTMTLISSLLFIAIFPMVVNPPGQFYSMNGPVENLNEPTQRRWLLSLWFMVSSVTIIALLMSVILGGFVSPSLADSNALGSEVDFWLIYSKAGIRLYELGYWFFVTGLVGVILTYMATVFLLFDLIVECSIVFGLFAVGFIPVIIIFANLKVNKEDLFATRYLFFKKNFLDEASYHTSKQKIANFKIEEKTNRE